MQLFIDTANVEEIRAANELGVISGVTTNPSLIAREGLVFEEVIRTIVSIVNGPISAEVIAADRDGMVKEARELSRIHPNIVVKIPMTEEGLKAVKILSGEGIRTNVTLIFSPAQALLAARAGATYVSPFIGRLDDIAESGVGTVGDIATIFRIHGIETKIIAASIRGPQDVVDAAKNGAHIATVPYKIILQMVKHPLTDIGIKRFSDDWNRAFPGTH